MYKFKSSLIVFLSLMALITTTALLSCNMAGKLTPSGSGDRVNLYEGTAAQEGAAKFKEKIGGPVRAVHLAIFETYMILQAQDPKKPENVDQYEYRGGVVSDGVPVELSGRGKLEENLFNLDDVNLTALPEVARTGLERLNIEGAKITGMSLRRNLPFSKEIIWQINVQGTRKSGFIEADAKGKITTARIL